MSLRRLPLMAAASIPALCGVWLGSCSQLMTACPPLKVGWHLLPVTIGLMLTGAGTAWLARFAWLAVDSFYILRQLPHVPPPEKLMSAAHGSGVWSLRCIDLPEPVAFCAGLARPTVFASTGLPARLRGERLMAVLVHEQHHARRFEPLRRLAAQAAADVLFFLPVLVWWAARRAVVAELAADRAAIRAVGRQPVAAAILAVGSGVPAGVAAFAGAIDARARQLLGQPPELDGISRQTGTLSVIGLGLAASASLCAAQMLLTVH